MSKILIKGLDDTSELECSACGSWIAHWCTLKSLGADVIEWLQSVGRGYQIRMKTILCEAMLHSES